MDFDDLPKRKVSALDEAEKEDLSTWSKHELEERIQRLEAEITRTKTAVDARGTTRAAAEALFGKPQ